jgi:hypothetical protein
VTKHVRLIAAAIETHWRCAFVVRRSGLAEAYFSWRDVSRRAKSATSPRVRLSRGPRDTLHRRRSSQ